MREIRLEFIIDGGVQRNRLVIPRQAVIVLAMGQIVLAMG